MKNKSWIILLIVLITTLVPALIFSAGISISVSPIRVEHTVKHGEGGTDAISVTNYGTTPVRLKVSVQDWYLTRDGTPVFINDEGSPYSCSEWIKINPYDFRINPNQTKEVRYTVTVPEGIEDGGYRSAVTFTTVPDIKAGEQSRAVYLKGRIAVILYELVGKPIPQGYAKSLKADTRKDGVDFILTLKNAGKVHFRTKGSITIKDSNGDKAFKVELPDVPVLPGSERDIKVSYNKAVPKGSYMADAVVDIGIKELFGVVTDFEVE